MRSRGSLLDAALVTGVLARNGAWVVYRDRQLGQGREAALQALAARPALVAEIERRVRGGGQE